MTRISHLRSLREDIALELGVDAVGVVLDGGKLWMEVPREKRVYIRARNLPKPRANLKFPVQLGVGVGGEVVEVDLDDPNTPHLLIGGTTGSGKTVLLQSIVYSLVRNRPPSRVRLVVIDTKLSLTCLSGLAHLQSPVITDYEEARDALLGIAQITRWRYRDRINTPRLVVVVDEFADLIMLDRENGERGAKKVETTLVRIAQLGREAGVHLVIATQRPDRTIVTPLIHGNMPVRVALSVPSPWESRVIINGGGAETLLGRGDALIQCNGTLTRFQAAYADDDDLVHLTARYPVNATRTLSQLKGIR